jgi:hypothetical protein
MKDGANKVRCVALHVYHHLIQLLKF